MERIKGNAQPIILPILARRPDFEVGIPVAFAKLRLRLDIPEARFKLKESPGMPVFDLLANEVSSLSNESKLGFRFLYEPQITF